MGGKRNLAGRRRNSGARPTLGNPAADVKPKVITKMRNPGLRCPRAAVFPYNTIVEPPLRKSPLELTAEAITAVGTSLTGWKKATKGKCPPGYDWEDIEQNAYVAILEARPHDPSHGDLGPRVNAIVKRVFIDACRDKPREVTNILGPAEDHATYDPTVPDETYWAVDAADYLAALSPEDAAVVLRVRGSGLSQRDSATRRRESRVIQRLREGLK